MLLLVMPDRDCKIVDASRTRVIMANISFGVRRGQSRHKDPLLNSLLKLFGKDMRLLD